MPNDIKLMVEFCDKNYELFQEFIDETYEIEPSEAEVILKKVSKMADAQEEKSHA